MVWPEERPGSNWPVVAEDATDEVRRLRRIIDLQASLCHEIRNRVTAVQGYAALLQAGCENGHSIDGAAVVALSDNVELLVESTDGLLQLSRSGVRGVALHPCVEDLGTAVARSAGRLLGTLGARKVTTDIEPDVRAVFDVTALDRVMTELLSNVAKYTPAEASVRVAVCASGDRAAVIVEDDGPGIPGPARTWVFDRYWRAGYDAGDCRGTGLGLAIVRELSTGMGAHVAATESSAGGARFVIEFPISGVEGADRDPTSPGTGQLLRRTDGYDSSSSGDALVADSDGPQCDRC